MKIAFPLCIQYPMLFYQEQSEGLGQWNEISLLELKIPSTWDMDDRALTHTTYSIQMEEYIGEGSIIVEHSTDLHYCSNFSYLAKDPYRIQQPPVQSDNYKFIFFKKYTSDDHLLVDIVGFHIKEKNIERIISCVLQKMIYESRYSSLGVIKQVEDQVDQIFYTILKKIIRFMALIQGLQYQNMYEVTRLVVHSPKVNLLERDIYSIVYKTILTTGLFPIHCEINTMNDSYLKLKLLSLFTNSEILPWSPKFHASLALANYHYSFTPNDLFNLRTLDSRKFHKGYQYMRLRILDFFPLDRWIELVSKFFVDNINAILDYIKLHINLPHSERSIREKKELMENLSSSRTNFLDIKEPFLREEQKETELMYDSRKSSRTSAKSIILEGSRLEQTEPFKQMLRNSIKSITKTSEMYGITINSLVIVEIKNQIAKEFYQNYESELNRNNILSHFCSIITETELRSYSTCANNCQTPVAAFIYLICDTFRPYSEVLYKKSVFLEQCNNEKLSFFNERNGSEYNAKKILSQKTQVSMQKSQFQINYDKTFGEYCRFASTSNLLIHGVNFIQPAILEQSLDYFGFFSDQLSSTFLKRIQKIDGNPYEFRKRDEGNGNSAEKEEELFRYTFQECQKAVLRQYTYIKEQNRNQLDQIRYLSQFLDTSHLNKQQIPPLNIHYLMQNYQNQINRMKQEEVANAMERHAVQDLFDEASFIYFNSIRMQLSVKNRKNTLSLIGFVVAKDLDQVNKNSPENVEIIKQLME